MYVSEIYKFLMRSKIKNQIMKNGQDVIIQMEVVLGAFMFSFINE